ncbi:hypothetical protein [Massilia varians]|uniref:hypothetical protein n=1 Tax=Massilia varians TaxID=457921 RepID=UPI002556505D|nr:hypothetical protein [Massilia varians]MDK6077920.1 hypothetical protein [Massilia varians]
MTDPIISKDMIRDKARAAHARGAGRDDHGFNWHAECAIATWQEEWDRCAQQDGCAFFRKQDEAQQLEVSPP